MKNPNIEQVSEYAGVSRVTVSRALNGDFRVRPQTVEKVLIAAREIGYKLPAIERRSQRVANGTLHKGILKTGQIALLVPERYDAGMQTPMFRSLQRGINECLFDHKIGLVTTHLGPNWELPICIQKKLVDGFIIRGNIHDSGFPKEVEDGLLRFPHVSTMYLTYETPEDLVVPDEGALGAIAAQEFAKRGCKNIVVLRPDDQRTDFALRAASFSFACKNLGIKVKELLFKEKFDTVSGISTNMQGLLKKVDKPDGIFVFHQIKNGGEVLKEMGWIPDNGVQACADLRDVSELKEFLPAGSFGVDLRVKQVGAAAAEQLLWRIQHPQAERRTISIRPELVTS